MKSNTIKKLVPLVLVILGLTACGETSYSYTTPTVPVTHSSDFNPQPVSEPHSVLGLLGLAGLGLVFINRGSGR